MKQWKWMRLAIMAVLMGGGCLHLDAKIRLNEDGSATITERMGYSRRVLDMDRSASLESLLSRSAAEDRARRMGAEVKVTRHEIRDGDRGVRESVTVYQAPNLTNLVYQSPFPAHGESGGLAFSLEPQLSFWRNSPPGPLWATFSAAKAPDARAGDVSERAAQDETPLAPREMQVFREMVEVFGYMLEDASIRIRFESYAPVIRTDGLVHRGQHLAWAGAGDIVYELDLLHVTGRSMDRYGYPILANEEVMLELLLGQWDGPVLGHHLSQMTDNPELPVLHRGRRGRAAISPSRPLFERYYRGETVDWTASRNREIRARGKVEATFEGVGGWDGPADETDESHPDRCPDDCRWCDPDFGG